MGNRLYRLTLATRNWRPVDYIWAWASLHGRLRRLARDHMEEGDPRLFNLLESKHLNAYYIGEQSARYDR